MNTTNMCEICSKLTTMTPDWYHKRRSDAFIVNLDFKHYFSVSIVDFEQLNAGWAPVAGLQSQNDSKLELRSLKKNLLFDVIKRYWICCSTSSTPTTKISQVTFTCSNSTIEALEKGMKYVNEVVLMFSLLTLKILHIFF